jgi:pimeloyl-ACP methyl ester carboxylesterase
MITPTDLEKYRAAWAQPGALTGMLNWYRAMFRTRTQPPTSLKVTLPTLLMYGGRDPFLGQEMIQPSLDFCTQGELEIYPSAGHFTHLDEHEEVNHRLLTFFRP